MKNKEKAGKVKIEERLTNIKTYKKFQNYIDQMIEQDKYTKMQKRNMY